MRHPGHRSGGPTTEANGVREQPADVAGLMPERWRAFVRSGEYAGGRGLIKAKGSRMPVDFAAKLEFVDESNLAIHVTLAEEGHHDEQPQNPERPLTFREREVVALIACGYETGPIADELSISEDTVRTHVRNAMSKLGAHTRAQLIAMVMSAEPAP